MNCLLGSLPSVFCGSKNSLFSKIFEVYLHTSAAMHQGVPEASSTLSKRFLDRLPCLTEKLNGFLVTQTQTLS